MKVDTQQLPDSQVALSFEVDDDRVERAMDAAYRRLAGRVNIAGFRKGKAPRPLVERVVGRESLIQEALNQLLPEAYNEAVREANLRALTEPEFDVESLKPLRAKATVVVEPPVRLGDYQSIRRDPPTVAVSPAEIDSVVEQLRQRHAQWVPVERPGETGDRVTLDVVGTSGQKRIIQQQEVSYILDPESTSPLPGFGLQIVGMPTGETRTFELPVAPNHRDHDLAGKTVKFQVTMKDVKGKELPGVDDAFAATVGPYSSLEELRTVVEEQLRERSEAAARSALEEEILQEAVLFCSVQLPEKLIDQEVHRMRARLARDLDSRGLTVEQYMGMRRIREDELNTEFRSGAEGSLKRRLVLQKIAEAEGLEVPEEDVDAGIREALQEGDADERVVARALQRNELRERVRISLVEQRAARWLVEKALGSIPASGGSPAEILGVHQ